MVTETKDNVELLNELDLYLMEWIPNYLYIGYSNWYFGMVEL